MCNIFQFELYIIVLEQTNKVVDKLCLIYSRTGVEIPDINWYYANRIIMNFDVSCLYKRLHMSFILLIIASNSLLFNFSPL